jgi:hypothetical protein
MRALTAAGPAMAIRLASVGFPVYFAGELLQMPAYRPDAPSRVTSAAWCGLAAAGDVAILLALWGVAAWAFDSPSWFLWAYQAWQPTLPPLDTDIVAVLQPMVVPPVAFWWVHRRAWRPARLDTCDPHR